MSRYYILGFLMLSLVAIPFWANAQDTVDTRTIVPEEAAEAATPELYSQTTESTENVDPFVSYLATMLDIENMTPEEVDELFSGDPLEVLAKINLQYETNANTAQAEVIAEITSEAVVAALESFYAEVTRAEDQLRADLITTETALEQVSNSAQNIGLIGVGAGVGGASLFWLANRIPAIRKFIYATTAIVAGLDTLYILGWSSYEEDTNTEALIAAKERTLSQLRFFRNVIGSTIVDINELLTPDITIQ